MLARHPGFALTAILTLALGIGANTAIFSVVNAMLLRPLPFRDSDRLVTVWSTAPQLGYAEAPFAYGNLVDLARENRVFDHIGTWVEWGGSFNLATDEPEQLPGAYVSSGLFAVLGVSPTMGRTFLPEDDQGDRHRVALLSHGLWERRFGSDPAAPGSEVMLEGRSYTVVGVMPASFTFPTFGKIPEVWLPLSDYPYLQKTNRNAHDFGIVARLKPGISVIQAQANMDAIAKGLEAQYPTENAGNGIQVVSLHWQAVRNVRLALFILLGAVAFVLLIACTNVANLLLGRAASRQKEVAVRLALGARRSRLVRQLVTESVLLAVAGGALGTLLALWGIQSLAVIPPGAPDPYTPYLIPANHISINREVLVFTLVLSVLTGVIFGLAPALQASKPDLNQVLKEGGTRASARHGRSRSLLVVSEIALSLMLLAGAGLMLKSFLRLRHTDPGFNPDHLVTADISLPIVTYYRPALQKEFYRQVLQRVQSLPGVLAAGITTGLPLTGNDNNRYIELPGQPDESPERRNSAQYHYVSHGYFRAMGFTVVEGRTFTEQDKYDAPRVAVINETLARRYWPRESAIGKQVKPSGEEAQQIVGVVKDARYFGLESVTLPELYAPYLQQLLPSMTLVVRSSSDPTSLASAIRSEVLAIDKNQAIGNIQLMRQRISDSVAGPRHIVYLVSLFALLALVLAAIGVYGVMANSVIQRTHEIGIRVALGAQGSDLLRLVLGRALVLILAGVAVGLVGTVLLSGLMSKLLFGISATDPQTLVMISLILIGIALLAAYLPARRAVTVDPLVALRYE
jgi:putative ABC transport system permease protein